MSLVKHDKIMLSICSAGPEMLFIEALADHLLDLIPFVCSVCSLFLFCSVCLLYERLICNAEGSWNNLLFSDFGTDYLFLGLVLKAFDCMLSPLVGCFIGETVTHCISLGFFVCVCVCVFFFFPVFVCLFVCLFWFGWILAPWSLFLHTLDCLGMTFLVVILALS